MKVNERRKENGKHTLIKVVKNHDKVCMDICRFIYVNALYFISKKKKKRKEKKRAFVSKMINSAIEYEKKLKLPTYHDINQLFEKRS